MKLFIFIRCKVHPHALNVCVCVCVCVCVRRRIGVHLHRETNERKGNHFKRNELHCGQRRKRQPAVQVERVERAS